MVNFLKYSGPEFSDYLTYLHTDNFYDCQFYNRMQNAVKFAKTQDVKFKEEYDRLEAKTPNISTEYGTLSEPYKKVGTNKVKNIVDLNQ